MGGCFGRFHRDFGNSLGVRRVRWVPVDSQSDCYMTSLFTKSNSAECQQGGWLLSRSRGACLLGARECPVTREMTWLGRPRVHHVIAWCVMPHVSTVYAWCAFQCLVLLYLPPRALHQLAPCLGVVLHTIACDARHHMSYVMSCCSQGFT